MLDSHGFLPSSLRSLRDLEHWRDRPADAALAAMMENLRTWSAPDTLEDDVTLLAIDVTGC